MTTPFLRLALLASAALAAFAASAAFPAVGALPTPAAAVDVVDFAFQDGTTGGPVTLASSSGSVTWTDVSGFHSVTAADGSFDSGELGPGETYTLTGLAPGAYPYSCIFHASMRGVLVVA